MIELVGKIISEKDTGVGLDPLLQKFVWGKMGVDPDKLKRRERAITSYYREIYKRSNDVKVAYDRTNEWARKVFP